MVLDLEQIKDFMPHRAPFLFVDKITEIDNPVLDKKDKEELEIKDVVGSKISGEFFLRPDLEIFKGHFPGNPVWPGVIQVEMMAQVACFNMYNLYEDPKNNQIQVALLGIKNAKFRKPLKPGMHLNIEARCMRVRGNIMSYECHISYEGEIVSEAEILASVEL